MPDQLSLTRPLLIHDLTYLAEADEVIVGRTDIDSYGLFPVDGAALIKKLASGSSPIQAASWYESTYGEPVDMSSFVNTLAELDFLVRDGRPTIPGNRPVRGRRLGRWLFSPVALTAYAATIAIAVGLCVHDPMLAPRPRQLFFTSYLLILQIVLVFGQLPLILIHEWFHVLAARRIG